MHKYKCLDIDYRLKFLAYESTASSANSNSHRSMNFAFKLIILLPFTNAIITNEFETKKISQKYLKVETHADTRIKCAAIAVKDKYEALIFENETCSLGKADNFLLDDDGQMVGYLERKLAKAILNKTRKS